MGQALGSFFPLDEPEFPDSLRPLILMPQKGPQHDYIDCLADIAVYGGSAFGGKTWALLAEPLKWIHIPLFAGVVFRRTFPQITVEGGLWDESCQIYPHVGGRPIFSRLEWVFPSGATIRFAHLQHEANKYDWQGSQVPYFGFDELTHFTESMFTYIVFSRGRSNCGVRPYVRCTCNPDPGWVRDFIAPWVHDDYPGDRASSGQVLGFKRVGSDIQWVDPSEPETISLTFIRASIYDNKIGLAQNPGYLANLKALLPVERARLLDGDWNVRRSGLVYPEFDGCVVECCPDASVADVGGIDFGFNHPFAAIGGHLDHDGVLWLTYCRSVRQQTNAVHSAALPGGIRWYADPSQPGTIQELRNAGHDVVPCVHLSVRGGAGTPRTPVLAGIDQVTERMRTGRLKIVRGACKSLLKELALYHYDEDKRSEEPIKEDDHACDALRYLVVGMDRGKVVPTIPEPVEIPSDLEDPSLWSN